MHHGLPLAILLSCARCSVNGLKSTIEIKRCLLYIVEPKAGRSLCESSNNTVEILTHHDVLSLMNIPGSG